MPVKIWNELYWKNCFFTFFSDVEVNACTQKKDVKIYSTRHAENNLNIDVFLWFQGQNSYQGKIQGTRILHHTLHIQYPRIILKVPECILFKSTPRIKKKHGYTLRIEVKEFCIVIFVWHSSEWCNDWLRFHKGLCSTDKKLYKSGCVLRHALHKFSRP